MRLIKCFFSTVCDVLVLLGVLGLVIPSYSFAKDKGGQQEVGNDRQDNGDDEDKGDHASDDKDQIKRCLHALSQGKKLPKKCPQGGSSSGIAKADFNGDGRSDLAIGIPGRDFGGVRDAGAVAVLFGSQDGLTDIGARFFDFFSLSFRLGA